MINIGKFNKFKVSKKVDFGYFLDAGLNKEILLPKSQLNNATLEIGQEIEVFVYRDSNDKLVATLKKPLTQINELAYLRVAQNTEIGTFVDIGLSRDVLVPMRERLYRLEVDSNYLFYVYLDKTSRLAATTNVDEFLETTHSYEIGDSVTGVVYGFQSNNSAMVAIDNKYKGVILHNEYFTSLSQGDVLDLKVIKIYEDNRLGLTPRKSAQEEVDALQTFILDYLKSNDGFMPYNDKSAPEDISKVFNASKKQFKRTLGNLMKQDLVQQDSTGTKLK